jgi:hypothetical protein
VARRRGYPAGTKTADQVKPPRVSNVAPSKRVAPKNAVLGAGPAPTAPPPARPLDVQRGVWRAMLGDKLAGRVLSTGLDPARFCRDAVEQAVRRHEEQAATARATTRHQARCGHPGNQRSPNGRCKACGAAVGAVLP